jgi:hypothetical protein
MPSRLSRGTGFDAIPTGTLRTVELLVGHLEQSFRPFPIIGHQRGGADTDRHMVVHRRVQVRDLQVFDGNAQTFRSPNGSRHVAPGQQANELLSTVACD